MCDYVSTAAEVDGGETMCDDVGTVVGTVVGTAEVVRDPSGTQSTP